MVDFGRRCRETSLQLYADQLLLLPIPLQIEQTAGQSKRATAGLVSTISHQRARLAGSDPLLRIRPRQRSHIDHGLHLIESCGLDRAEINADRAMAERADRQGEREPDPLVDVSPDPAHHIGGVHVSRIENSRLVEDREQTRCCLDYQRAVGDTDGQLGLHGHDSTPSSSAESSTTSGAGGRQPNTPQGTPSTRGVSAPAIPRTNR